MSTSIQVLDRCLTVFHGTSDQILLSSVLAFMMQFVTVVVVVVVINIRIKHIFNVLLQGMIRRDDTICVMFLISAALTSTLEMTVMVKLLLVGELDWARSIEELRGTVGARILELRTGDELVCSTGLGMLAARFCRAHACFQHACREESQIVLLVSSMVTRLSCRRGRIGRVRVHEDLCVLRAGSRQKFVGCRVAATARTTMLRSLGLLKWPC